MLVSQKNTDPDLGTTGWQGEKHVTSPAMTETDSPLHGAEISSTTWMPACSGPEAIRQLPWTWGLKLSMNSSHIVRECFMNKQKRNNKYIYFQAWACDGFV